MEKKERLPLTDAACCALMSAASACVIARGRREEYRRRKRRVSKKERPSSTTSSVREREKTSIDSSFSVSYLRPHRRELLLELAHATGHFSHGVLVVSSFASRVGKRDGEVPTARRETERENENEKCDSFFSVFFLNLNKKKHKKGRERNPLPPPPVALAINAMQFNLSQGSIEGGGGKRGKTGNSPRATSSCLRSNQTPPPVVFAVAVAAATADLAAAAAASTLAIALSRACGGVIGGEGKTGRSAAAELVVGNDLCGWRCCCCCCCCLPSPLSLLRRRRPASCSLDLSHAAGASRSLSQNTRWTPDRAGRLGERTCARNSVRSISGGVGFSFFHFFWTFFDSDNSKIFFSKPTITTTIIDTPPPPPRSSSSLNHGFAHHGQGDGGDGGGDDARGRDDGGAPSPPPVALRVLAAPFLAAAHAVVDNCFYLFIYLDLGGRRECVRRGGKFDRMLLGSPSAPAIVVFFSLPLPISISPPPSPLSLSPS